MKPTRILAALLALCLMLTVFAGCGADKSSKETSKDETGTQAKCDHEFKDGYCTNCKEMDPSCKELTADNYEDYLDISYKIADVDGSTGGSYGFVPFAYLYLTAAPASSRVTFYNVEIEMQFTVKQCLYPSNDYEECTVTAKIPIELFGEGEAKARLERESNDPVLLKGTYISEYKIVSISGCVSVQ